MSGVTMIYMGIAMIAGSVILSLALNIVFAITRKKMISKIYNEIENN